MTIELDTRIIAYVIWGAGTVFIYGYVMDRRYRSYLDRRDRRSRREFTAAIALFLTALAASLAIFISLFNPGDGEALRGFLSALALGAFFAAGVVMATDRNPK